MGAAALKAGHSNTIFTVRDVVDDTGTVIQSYEFNEHGIPMPGSGASSGTFSPKTYQGALSVNDDRNDSGLYLMGHRHWDPTLSRFISRDPIGFSGGLNLYGAEFGNNPVTFTDETGLDVYLDLVVVEGGTYNQLGHAFLEVTPIAGTKCQWQAKSSYATYPPKKPGDSAVVPDTDLTFGYGAGTTRQRLRIRLNESEERKLLKLIQDAKKNEKWSPLNNCGNFALDIWNTLAPSALDIDPLRVMESIDPSMVTNEQVRLAIKLEKLRTGKYPQAVTPRKMGDYIESR